MQYSIRHITHFEYDSPIRESAMEVRVCPRSESYQHCYAHELHVTPTARLFSNQDAEGNIVHHFDIPVSHDSLRLESRALVEVLPPPDLPERLTADAWSQLDELVDRTNLLGMVLPSRFTARTDRLRALESEFDIVRRDDPLSLLHEINRDVFRSFEYNPASTHVHSPIDDALEHRAGVCQDFAHIFIALARELGIPCRYVSGYLFHRSGEDGDRSAEDGSHAWAEAYLPEIGWVGFDPTNNLIVGERHIRVAIGRDYADVPPTRGIYKGEARSTLRVGVHVSRAAFMAREDVMPELARVKQEEQLDIGDAVAARLRQQHLEQ